MCEGGDLQACNEIGIYYERTNQPYLASGYFGKVCDGGQAVGCSNLAELYFDGRGVERNYQTALGLFNNSCGQGNTNGCAGMCITLARLGQLNPDVRDTCHQALDQACANGNPWMCDRSIAAASPAPTTPPPNAGVGGCQGPNLDRSRQLIESAWFAGVEIGTYVFNTDDLFGGLNRLIAISQQIDSQSRQLPNSCQVLIRSWMDQIGQTFPEGGGAQCVSGVCCDDAGCL